MKLTKDEIKDALEKWNRAWDDHDLDGVMALFHDDVLFENWTGGRAFTPEDTFIDEDEQKVLYRWQLDWPSFEKGFDGKPETRRGVDVIHFQDGKIIQKLTYSKTTIEIKGQRIRLLANPF
jgi:ketosteroid isomerase-like protein